MRDVLARPWLLTVVGAHDLDAELDLAGDLDPARRGGRLADRGVDRAGGPGRAQGLRPGSQRVAQFGSPLGMQCLPGYAFPAASR